jgi:hypothetical protein
MRNTPTTAFHCFRKRFRMKNWLLIFVSVSICYANGLFIETSLENRFSPKYFDKYDNILQGPNISFNYHLKSVLFGIGFGPVLMNGYDPANDSLTDLMYANSLNMWGDFYYTKNFRWANSSLCFGGRIGSIADSYDLVYDTNNTWSNVVENYEVTDTYYAALGSKFVIGFKFIRFVFGAFWNFGNRKESFTPDYYYYYGNPWVKNKAIVAFQLDLGLIAVIGKDY